MAKSTDEEHSYYHVLRVVIVSFIKGSPPSIAVEFGRRAIPGHLRPSFQEMEKYLKGGGADSAAAAPPPAPAAAA
jgi:chemotaxis protein MotA